MRTGARDWAGPAPPPGGDFYYATLYARPQIRDTLWRLEAFRREIARIPASCSDPGVARMKLAWWRDEIDRIGAARPQHEISRALVPLVAVEPALKRVLAQTVAGVDSGLGREVPRGTGDCIARIDEMHGALWSEYGRICGALDERTPAAVRGLGCWIELGYDLRDLRTLREAHLLPISLESLRRHGLSPDDLGGATAGAALRPVLEHEIDAAAGQIRSAIAAIPRHDRRRQRFAVTLGHIVAATLDEVARDGYRVLEHRVELPPIRKLWTAWRIRISG